MSVNLIVPYTDLPVSENTPLESGDTKSGVPNHFYTSNQVRATPRAHAVDSWSGPRYTLEPWEHTNPGSGQAPLTCFMCLTHNTSDRARAASRIARKHAAKKAP